MSAADVPPGEFGGGVEERPTRGRSPPPEVREAVAREPLFVDHDAVGTPGSQQVSQQAGILRKKLYDQNIADWSARYRKNKQTLENLARDCEMLRTDVARQQQEVDERAESYRALEERFSNEVYVRYSDARDAFESATQQKSALQVQLSEYRKSKSQLTREKKTLTADYERKHAELMRMAEVRDRLDSQLAQVTQQLGQLSTDRRRMERELDLVQHNLRANTELADEVHNEIRHVFRGVKDSMDLHMAPASRLEVGSVGSQGFEDQFEKQGEIVR